MLWVCKVLTRDRRHNPTNCCSRESFQEIMIYQFFHMSPNKRGVEGRVPLGNYSSDTDCGVAARLVPITDD